MTGHGEGSGGGLRIFDQGDRIDGRTSHQVYEYRKGKVLIYLFMFIFMAKGKESLKTNSVLNILKIPYARPGIRRSGIDRSPCRRVALEPPGADEITEERAHPDLEGSGTRHGGPLPGNREEE